MQRIILSLMVVIVSQLAYGQSPCDHHTIGKEKTPLGRIIEYKKVDETGYRLYFNFQNEDERSLQERFDCGAPKGTTPRFEAEDEHYILLSKRCGYACRVAVILPENSNKEIKEIEHWLAYDLKQKLIVSLGIGFDSKSLLIKLFNLEDYKETTYDTGVRCEYGISIDCVRQVEILANEIKITWDQGIKTPPFEIDTNK